MSARPFLNSYGGGHSQMIIALANELISRGRSIDLLGLTTAYNDYIKAGLPAMNVTALFDPRYDEQALAAAQPFIPQANHPAVSQAHTNAYFALGMRDLMIRFGELEAQRMVAKDGRKSFEPVTVYERYFAKNRPSVIVTTTSPRFESASIKAGRKLGIPTIAVSDLFLQSEQVRILSDKYADHLTVFAPEVADRILSAGLQHTKVHVLGNPAFDTLATIPRDEAKPAALKKRFGLSGYRVILWPLGGTQEKVAGRNFLNAGKIVGKLDAFCKLNPDHRFVLRPHPNWPVPQIDSQYGFLDDQLTVNEFLSLGDIVCVEASTVGLQAVLKSIPTICYKFADYAIYPTYGWAAQTNSMDEMFRLIVDGPIPSAPPSVTRNIGTSANSIVNLIERHEQI